MAPTLNYLRPLFVEEQGFRRRWIVVFGVIALAALVFISGVVWSVGRGAATLVPLTVIAVVMIGVPLLIAFANLHTVIDAAGLHVRYFPFVRRTFPLEQIVSWEVMAYDPMEYGGWGVRGLPDKYGWAYSAYGHKGVRITFTNGQRLMLGTQRPEELAAVLAEARSPVAREREG